MEDKHTECKIKWKDDIKDSVIAFLNSEGGKVYIGIDNDGTTVGIDNKDKLELQITDALRSGIEKNPTKYFEVKFIEKDEKKICIIEVLEGEKKPYYRADKGPKPSRNIY